MKQEDIVIAGSDTARPLNLAKRLKQIRPYIKPGVSKVLDGGCGKGDYVVALRERFNVDAWGVEFIDDKVTAFQNKYPELDWVTRGDLQNLDYAEDTFDVVILNEVLEHVPDDMLALSEMYRVLKPDGKLILFSPNRFYPFETHGVYLRHSSKKISTYTPFIPYIPLAIGEKIFKYWARNYWPRQLRRMVENTGFNILKTTYLWQTFENISGTQAAILKKNKILMRKIANFMEQVPVLKSFGVSQVIVGEKN